MIIVVYGHSKIKTPLGAFQFFLNFKVKTVITSYGPLITIVVYGPLKIGTPLPAFHFFLNFRVKKKQAEVHVIQVLLKRIACIQRPRKDVTSGECSAQVEADVVMQSWGENESK